MDGCIDGDERYTPKERGSIGHEGPYFVLSLYCSFPSFDTPTHPIPSVQQQVGSLMKTPRFPIWVLGSSSHFSVLFSMDKGLWEDTCVYGWVGCMRVWVWEGVDVIMHLPPVRCMLNAWKRV